MIIIQGPDREHDNNKSSSLQRCGEDAKFSPLGALSVGSRNLVELKD
jgi:hypothetical protein